MQQNYILFHIICAKDHPISLLVLRIVLLIIYVTI